MKMFAIQFWQTLQTLWQNKNKSGFIIRMLLIFIFLFIFFSILEEYKQKKEKTLDVYQQMSTYNAGSSGTMALKEFLVKCGFKTQPILKSLTKITGSYREKKQYHSFLPVGIIMIIDPEYSITSTDKDIFIEKAKQGFTIMLFSGNQEAFFPFLSSKKETIPWNLVLSNYMAAGKNLTNNSVISTRIRYDKKNIFSGINKISLPDRTRFKKVPGSWQVLAADRMGPFLIYKKQGKGEIILISDTKFLSNYDLQRDDNAFFIYKLLKAFDKNRIIYFNEYFHGFQQKYTMVYFLAKKNYSYIILQVSLFLGLFFIAAGIKFGQYKRTDQLRTDKIYYYSEGIANLLAKRKYKRDITELMVQNFKREHNIKPTNTSYQILKKIGQVTANTKKRNSALKEIHSLIKNK